MGSRLGRRVIHFANLPIKLILPKQLSDISEIALKTIPSATKIEIKRVLESLYGFDVEKVRTLNMEGKKKKRGGIVLAAPDYKKAYVTLRSPLSLSPDLFPIKFLKEEKERSNLREREAVMVEENKTHWLDWKKKDLPKEIPQLGQRANRRIDRPTRAPVKFPWNSMKMTKTKKN